MAFLERSPEQRSVEAERYQRIVAGLTQTNNRLSTRVLKLEAPPPPPTPSRTSEGAAQNVAEATPDAPWPRARKPRRAHRGRGGGGCSGVMIREWGA